MKYIIQSLTFFMLAMQITFAQWALTKGPKGVPIYSFTISGLNIFAASDTSDLFETGGSVYLSTNDGEEWVNVSSGLICPAIYSLAINGTSIFAGSLGGGVYFSNNMGLNWINMNSGLANSSVYTLLVSPNETGSTNLYAGTLGGGVYRFSNISEQWENISVGLTNYEVYSLDFMKTKENDIFLFAGTGGNGVFVSSNYGLTWTQTTLGDYFIRALKVIDTNIFASAEGSGLFLSKDKGVSWSNVSNGISLPLALKAIDTNIFALTDWGSIYFSSNYGDKWTLINEGITDTLLLAIGISGNYIFASGIQNGIWRRPLSDIITNFNRQIKLPQNYSLEQNYPNPFNPNTTIEYSIPKQSNVTIKVFDVLGSEVATLINKEQSQGNYEVEFDGSDLTSGIYFYRLQAGDFIETKKMILLK